MKITEDKVKELITTINKGLTAGLGNPRPGEMCVMHAISVIIEDDEYSDSPTCVNEIITDFDIWLNDHVWSSKKARARGMIREAVAKLGSTKIDGYIWMQDVIATAITETDYISKQLKHLSKGIFKEDVHIKLYIDNLIEKFESGEIVLFEKSWDKNIDNILYVTELLDDEIHEFFTTLNDVAESEYDWKSVLEQVMEYYSKSKDKTYAWLSNIAADVCTKHKTEGSKFLYLLK